MPTPLYTNTTSKRLRVFEAIALVLVLCITHVIAVKPVVAVTRSNSVETNVARENVVMGRLLLLNNRTIVINGNYVGNGTTIFSGTRLQTPESITATVALGKMATLNIEPNTDLTLTFTKDYVDVKLIRGNVFLITDPGVKGSVASPDGKTMLPNSLGALPQGGGGINLTNKQKAAIISIIGGILVILGITLPGDCDNDSPSGSQCN